MNAPTTKPSRSLTKRLIRLMNFDDPIVFFKRLLFIIVLSLIFLDILVYPFVSNFFQNIIIEAHGILVDANVIGWRNATDSYEIDPTQYQDDRGVYYLIKLKTV